MVFPKYISAKWFWKKKSTLKVISFSCSNKKTYYIQNWSTHTKCCKYVCILFPLMTTTTRIKYTWLPNQNIAAIKWVVILIKWSSRYLNLVFEIIVATPCSSILLKKKCAMTRAWHHQGLFFKLHTIAFTVPILLFLTWSIT